MEHLPTIQNLLETPRDKRNTKANECYEQIEPFLLSFMQKKQGSRVIQLVYKWGDELVKNGILAVVKAHIKDLLKSKYALYVILKLVQNKRKE